MLSQILKPIQDVLEYVILFFYQYVVANYGVCIIFLTIVVRVVLIPLTISQTRSLAKMQKLQPELKEIQRKYKDDRQKMQEEIMKFYQKNNVNPLAGCLPLLLQMPVFFALFQMLRAPSSRVLDVVGENFNFLWMNLNSRDPYFILPILMVITMFLSSKLSTTDPKQSTITYIMPLVFGAISWNLPSGILVYWVTTNIWQIGQQWLVNKMVAKEGEKGSEKEKEKKEPGGDLVEQKTKEAISKRKKKRKKR
ncbi:MAG: YidC/Oxa1 family membrane protein insertase [Actinobacteria bacterium]|nr:YidC/Oxa1 family membrane protein insertase [Actinomycetota bacterium]